MERRSADELAAHFLRASKFWFRDCGAYATISKQIAMDRDLLNLASHAKSAQTASYLLFASVHYLVSLLETNDPCQFDAAKCSFRDFRDFCLSNYSLLKDIVASKLVQTNEVGRSSLIVIALALIAKFENRPISLVDIGSSVGLMLYYDTYHITFRQNNSDLSHSVGDADSVLGISCTTDQVGMSLASAASRIKVVSRFGVEQAPLDIDRPEDELWLHSLVKWGGEERESRLAKALAITRANRCWKVIGAATSQVQSILEGAAMPDVPLCLLESFVLGQMTASDLGEYARAINQLATATRPVYRVQIEWQGLNCRLFVLRHLTGENVAVLGVGTCHPHGKWVVMETTGEI